MGFLDASGVSAIWAKCKAAFAAKSHGHANATKAAAGFMSAEDKAAIESLSSGAVTGVKGAKESAYRTGNVDISPENIGAFSGNVQVVEDMSLANLLSLPPGAYLVSSAALESPVPGSYGNMILSNAMPEGWTGRVNAIVAFDNGAVRVAVGGGWENGFFWRNVDNYLPSMNGILPVSLGGTGGENGAAACSNIGALPLSGGSLSSPYAQISREGRSMSWYNGRDGAIVRQNTYTGYNPIMSAKTANGTWEIGTYENDGLYFNLVADWRYSQGNNSPDAQFIMMNSGILSIRGRSAIHGAVLYNNITGTQGTVYLSESVANFSWLRIFYRDNDWVKASIDVHSPESTIAGLCISAKTTSGVYWHKARSVNISGTTITNRTAGCVSLNIERNQVGGETNVNNVWITAVIGYVL